jgi:hypothetical protein
MDAQFPAGGGNSEYAAIHDYLYICPDLTFQQNPPTMRTILLFVVVFATSQAYAQKDKEKYTKLFDMYTMEKYVKCIDAAENYTTSDKTAKDPEPYLYIAMSFFEISKDPDRFDLKKYPELKDPMKKAVNYTAKFVKKDKDGSLRAENKEFMEELKEASVETIKGMYERKETSKYASFARDLSKAYDKDYPVMFLTGMYLVYGNAQSDGLKNIDIAMENLKKTGKPEGGFERLDKHILTDAFIMYSNYLNDSKDKKKAQSVMDLAKELLPDSEEIKKQAEVINK